MWVNVTRMGGVSVLVYINNFFTLEHNRNRGMEQKKLNRNTVR